MKILRRSAKCSICGSKFSGHGHNAQPVNDGRCCSYCNSKIVIPTRFLLVKLTTKKGENNEKF